MESFSTNYRSSLPWAANLATLAVVVVTTWWSGAQRPAQAPMAQVEQAAPQPQEGGLPTRSQPAGSTQKQEQDAAPLRVKADGGQATLIQAALGSDQLPANGVQTLGFKASPN